ncbi:MAG: protease modulator HflC [Proteobacteria bacterium]|nr:protease modulator HflC [Pseudomonadota bacterium]
MKRNLLLIISLALLAVVILSATIFTVDQTQQALILELGKPKRDIKDPGLKFKIPFLQQVTLFDLRLLEYDAESSEIITQDKKNLIVDNYTRWRITDPLKYFQSIRNEAGARARLDDIIYSNVRQELGRYTLTQIVSEDRSKIMGKITELSNQQALAYGIQVLDVRIKRADLPPENEKAVFGRMKAERERQAKQYRSEGEEGAQRIRAEAEREKSVILAEAYRSAQILRGEGDAKAARIYAGAYNQDPQFFALVRSLDSYQKSLKEKTTIILDPSSEFFHYLKSSR